MKGMYQWLGKHVHAPYGTAIFGLLVFIEGFFIVPVSTLLAFFSLENRPRAFNYAIIATLISAFGALAGYFLGRFIWHSGGEGIIHYFISPDKFRELIEQFRTYQAWTIFTIALSPVPFKLLTLSAGFCKLPLVPFILLSMFARGLRFFAISGAIYLWGEQVQYYIQTYFYYLLALLIAVVIAMHYILH